MRRKDRDKVQGRDDAANELRVTDRRRISLDPENTEQTTEANEVSSLKPSYVEDLENRTRAAERQVQEVQARFEQLRGQMQRETDETRQRLNRAADERASGEKARFIAGLLPVMDDLNRAFEAANAGSPRETIVEGMKSILTSFQNALTKAGVETLSSVGDQFDPELHEAVDTEEVTPELDGKVTAEYTRGFRIGDRLLRPARVKVGRAPGHAKIAID